MQAVLPQEAFLVFTGSYLSLDRQFPFPWCTRRNLAHRSIPTVGLDEGNAQVPRSMNVYRVQGGSDAAIPPTPHACVATVIDCCSGP